MFATKLPARRLQIRLLGVGVSGLDRPEAIQLSLFPDPQHEQQTRLDEVADRIREKFGGGSLQRGLGMLHDVEPRSDPNSQPILDLDSADGFEVPVRGQEDQSLLASERRNQQIEL